MGGSKTPQGPGARPRCRPATRSSSRQGLSSGPPAQSAQGWDRLTPCPRGIIGGFRLECPAMFLWTDLVELVRHPFSALRLIDARRPLADGLAALALSVTLPAAVAGLGPPGPFPPPGNLGSLPSRAAPAAGFSSPWAHENRTALPVYG